MGKLGFLGLFQEKARTVLLGEQEIWRSLTMPGAPESIHEIYSVQQATANTQTITESREGRDQDQDSAEYAPIPRA